MVWTLRHMKSLAAVPSAVEVIPKLFFVMVVGALLLEITSKSR